MKKVILTYNSINQELKIEIFSLNILKNWEYTDKWSEIISTEILSDLGKKYIIPKDEKELDAFINWIFKESNSIRWLVCEDGFITNINII